VRELLAAGGLLIGCAAGLAAAPGLAPATELRWVAGDPHVHTTAWGCDRDQTPEGLVALMGAHHLDVAASLLWGAGYERDAPEFSGHDHVASTPDHILHYDLEVSHFDADRGGHLVLLGLRRAAYWEEWGRSPRSGVPIVDWALAQDPRVTVGVAHGFKWPADGSFPHYDTWGRPMEFPIHVARGRAHFLSTELVEPGQPVDAGTWRLWTLLLDSGFRVSLLGASDLPCIQHLLGGAVLRTQAAVEGELSYESWLAAIRAGRTVLTSGPEERLDLSVAGTRLGGELVTRGSAPLAVTLDARLELPGAVEILANGVPVWSASFESGPHHVETEISLPTSAWVVARTPRALTSPVYVLLDGRPIRPSAEAPCHLVRYVDFLVEHASRGPLALDEDLEPALTAYAEARQVFMQRFREAGGATCP
jgi:hypothetical protein